MNFIELTLWNGEPISIRYEDILKFSPYFSKKKYEGMNSSMTIAIPSITTPYVYMEPKSQPLVTPVTTLTLRETYKELKEIINNGQL